MVEKKEIILSIRITPTTLNAIKEASQYLNIEQTSAFVNKAIWTFIKNLPDNPKLSEYADAMLRLDNMKMFETVSYADTKEAFLPVNFEKKLVRFITQRRSDEQVKELVVTEIQKVIACAKRPKTILKEMHQRCKKLCPHILKELKKEGISVLDGNLTKYLEGKK